MALLSGCSLGGPFLTVLPVPLVVAALMLIRSFQRPFAAAPEADTS
jgi:hypothetical protein